MKPIYLKMNSFGSFVDQEIDFSRLKENLFLICGDTGSGKSTIFDAIVFALYGQAGSQYRSKYNFQSEFAPLDLVPMVKFVFEIQHQTYTIVRKPKHKRLKKRKSSKEPYTFVNETVELYLEDGSVLNQKEADIEIEKIVGLTKPQFMQIAMIAQGEFRELLKSDSDKKREMFRKLFHTEKYNTIIEILKEKLTALNHQLNEMKMFVTLQVSQIQGMDSSQYFEAVKNGQLSFLESFLNELELKFEKQKEEYEVSVFHLEKILKQKEEINTKYIKANTLFESFQKLEKSKEEYSQLMNQKMDMDQLAEKIQKLSFCFEIQREYDWLIRYQKDLEKIQMDIQKEEKNLPVLEQNWKYLKIEKDKIQLEYEHNLKVYSSLEQKSFRILEAFDHLKELYETISKKEDDLKKKKEQFRLLERSCQKLVQELEYHEKIKEKYKDSLERYNERKEKINEILVIEDKIKGCLSLEEEYNQKEKEILNYAKEVQNLNRIYQNSKEKADASFQLYIASQAGILAKHLKENEPCPVCGSFHHPKLCSLPEQWISKEKMDEDNQKCEQLKSELLKKAASLQAYKENLNELNQKIQIKWNECFEKVQIYKKEEIQSYISDTRKQLEKEMDIRKKEYQQYLYSDQKWNRLLKKKEEEQTIKQNTSNVLISLREQIQSLNQNVLSIQKEIKPYQSKEELILEIKEKKDILVKKEKEYQNIQNQLMNLQKEKIQCESVLKENQKKAIDLEWDMKKQKEVVHSKFEQYKIKKEDYLKYLKENTKEQYEIDKKEWEAYNSKLHSLETLIQSLSYLEKEEKPDIQKLKVELDLIFKEAENQIQIHHEMKRIVKQNENVFYQLKENHQKRNKVISLQMRYEKLFRKLSGTMSKDAKMDIETFVQRYYLKQILVRANRRFEKLSAYQFHLVLKDLDDFGKVRNEGLDLMVHSLITNQYRDVSSLSGGESFMAALSLALGMADQIQETQGALHLNMMFIDEGFGSLDQVSLQQAIRILKEMATEEKCIGIISHVSELKEQIEQQLVVSKNEKGSRAKWHFD